MLYRIFIIINHILTYLTINFTLLSSTGLQESRVCQVTKFEDIICIRPRYRYQEVLYCFTRTVLVTTILYVHTGIFTLLKF